ncbi:unnamed protein product, partial [Linum tenue]
EKQNLPPCIKTSALPPLFFLLLQGRTTHQPSPLVFFLASPLALRRSTTTKQSSTSFLLDSEMALSNLSSKSLYASPHPLSSNNQLQSHQQPNLSVWKRNAGGSRSNLPSISAVHAAEPAKNPVKGPPVPAAPVAAPAVVSPPAKWTVDSWKTKTALQLPEYPNESDLQDVLKTIEDFPPLVFAGEARSLEEKLGDAAVGKAFLLQGGDCAESFKEFNANNIRDTFRILLQMGAVLMFGGQMPVIKGGRMAGQFAKPRSDAYEEIDGKRLPSYKGDNINGDTFDEKSRIPDPQRMIRAYCQSAATLNLLRAFATGGYAAMQRVTQWNLDFAERSEQGDRYQELANRVDEALGFMAAAGLTVEHPIMTLLNSGLPMSACYCHTSNLSQGWIPHLVSTMIAQLTCCGVERELGNSMVPT